MKNNKKNVREQNNFFEEQIAYLNKEKKELLNAIEMAINLSNFDTSLNKIESPDIILKTMAERVQRIITFKTIAFYLVNEEDSSFHQGFCDPLDESRYIENEVNILIDDKTFSLALRKNKAIIIYSSNGLDQIVLHPLLTSSRTRGMFVGILAQDKKDISDVSFLLFTIVMTTGAEALESFTLYKYIKDVNKILEANVAKLEDSERELIRHRDHLENLVEERTQSLKESEAKFRSIFENAVEGIFQITKNGHFINVNPALAAIHGYDSPEDLMKSVTNIGSQIFVDPKSQKEFMHSLEKNGIIHQFEAKTYRKDGGIRWVSINARQVHDNKLIYYEGTVEDITSRKEAEDELRKHREHLEKMVKERTAELINANEQLKEDIVKRKRVENALREAEEKYRSIFENAVEGIFQITSSGRFININPAFARIHGYDSPQEMKDSVKNVATDLCVDQQRYEEMIQTMKKNNNVRDFEMQMHRKDGKTGWISINAHIIRDEDGNPLYYEGTIMDVSDKKLLESQLLQSQKMEAVGRLAGGVAHDFNNILTGIIGYGSLLDMAVSKDDPLKNYIEPIMKSAKNAIGLTQALLAFSRKQIINLRPVNLNSVIGEAEKLYSRLIGEDIEFVIKLSDKKLTVMADRIQIEQVLMNLIANARDAMPHGGILTIRTELTALKENFIKTYGYGHEGNYALLSIEDTGTGMDEKTRENIFEPFFTTKGVGKGTGLGLAIAYGIIKQHNGYINCQSRLGKGTKFCIYIPITEHREEIFETFQAKESPAQGGNELVLVAEDNPDVRKLIKEVLEKTGYKVLEAVDGNDALHVFNQNKDDVRLMIIDVVMPKKNGKEVYVEIKKAGFHVKTIFISGYTADIINKKGVLEEGIDFIPKPIYPKKLLEKVREVLSKPP